MLRILINVLRLAIIGQVSVSSPKGCDELAYPENGMVVVIGNQATYSCVSGYNLFGNVNRFCSEQHGWNGTEPVCYKDCPEIQNNPQTILQINGHHYQSVATYTCLVGHCRETGDFIRTCLANGTWSGRELVCGKDCTQTTDGVTSGQYNHTDCTQTTDGVTSGQDNHKGLECFIQSEGTPSTSILCASGQHNISCGNNTVIALTEMAYGYKGNLSGCSSATGRCCTYDNTTDCLESSTTDTTLMELLSGRSDGNASIADAIASTTCTLGYMGISTFNMMSYQCIPVRRIFDMCEPGTYRSGNGLPIYIWNRDYGSGTSILNTDSSCSVSVEVPSLSKNIVLYTLHMQLYDSSGNCQQSITVSNGTNIVKTFGCNNASFNQIQSETIYGNFFILNLTNTAQSSGGKFWIGLQDSSESVPMLLSSPAVHRIDCGTLNKPTNGNVSIIDTFYGSIASYECDPGYVNTSGNTFRTCQENKTWSGHAVVCLYDCRSLADPENGFLSFTGTSPGHTATYGCDTGYVMDVGNIHRTCIDKIGWNGTALSCIYECGALTDPPNGSVSYNASTAGSQAIYACTGDLVPNGPVIRTCVAEKGWDGSEPACSPKTSDCGTLDHPANGTVSFSGTFPGQTANYSCNTNFIMAGGNAHRTCIEGAGWNGSAMLCIYDCGGLTNLTNGTVSYSTTTVSSKATYTCNSGFVLNGSPTRTCHSGTGWSGSEPTCVSHISECDDLSDPANGTVSFSLNISVRQATYICNDGFVLIGTQTRICVSGSGWSGSEPTCSFENSSNIVPTTDSFDIKTPIIVVTVIGALLVVSVIVGIVVYKRRLGNKTNENAFSRCCHCVRGDVTTRRSFQDLEQLGERGPYETINELISETSMSGPINSATEPSVTSTTYTNISESSEIHIDDGDAGSSADIEPKLKIDQE